MKEINIQTLLYFGSRGLILCRCLSFRDFRLVWAKVTRCQIQLVKLYLILIKNLEYKANQESSKIYQKYENQELFV